MLYGNLYRISDSSKPVKKAKLEETKTAVIPKSLFLNISINIVYIVYIVKQDSTCFQDPEKDANLEEEESDSSEEIESSSSESPGGFFAVLLSIGPNPSIPKSVFSFVLISYTK